MLPTLETSQSKIDIHTEQQFHRSCQLLYLCLTLYSATPVAKRLRALLLNLSIISSLSGMCSSPAVATCETNQVMLAGVPSGISRGSHVFAHLLIGPSHSKLR